MTPEVELVALNAAKKDCPLGSIPVAVLLFVQLYVVPLTPNVLVKGIMELLELAQIAKS